MKLNLKDVPRYVDEDSLNVVDIIVYVRDKIENPREIIVLDTDIRVQEEELAKALIFVDERRAKGHTKLLGLTADTACVVNLDKLGTTEPDDVIRYVHEFEVKYNVPTYIIYVKSENPEKANLFREKSIGHEISKYRIMYSGVVGKMAQLLDDGVDISKLADVIDRENESNSLNYAKLKEILSDVERQIEGGKGKIQSLAGSLTPTAKELLVYFNLKHGLSPVNMESYINILAELGYMYPMKRLSMYERLKYLEELPRFVGYSNPLIGDVYFMTIVEKVYPDPVFAYFSGSDRLVIFDKSNRRMQNLFLSLHGAYLCGSSGKGAGYRLIDPRVYFTESEEAFSASDKSGLVLRDCSDSKVDEKLVELFAHIEDAWVVEQMKRMERVDGSVDVTRLEPAYVSLKNTYIVDMLDESRGFHDTVFVYCRDTTGAVCQINSDIDYKGVRFLVQEEDFNRFIDSRLVFKKVSMEYSKYINESQEYMPAVYGTDVANVNDSMKNIVDPEVLLAANLLRPDKNGLSFYDRILRVGRNVLPIVLDSNSKCKDSEGVFKYINLQTLRKEYVAGKSISSCGTLRGMGLKSLSVSYEAFMNVRDLIE